MKPYYILLILLFSVTFASAQDSCETKKSESQTVVVNEGVDVNINNDVINEDVLVRASDIKIYLNFVRNVENIDLLFPKTNKIVKV